LGITSDDDQTGVDPKETLASAGYRAAYSFAARDTTRLWMRQSARPCHLPPPAASLWTRSSRVWRERWGAL